MHIDVQTTFSLILHENMLRVLFEASHWDGSNDHNTKCGQIMYKKKFKQMRLISYLVF